jgi:hypothetical protein
MPQASAVMAQANLQLYDPALLYDLKSNTVAKERR